MPCRYLETGSEYETHRKHTPTISLAPLAERELVALSGAREVKRDAEEQIDRIHTLASYLRGNPGPRTRRLLRKRARAGGRRTSKYRRVGPIVKANLGPGVFLKGRRARIARRVPGGGGHTPMAYRRRRRRRFTRRVRGRRRRTRSRKRRIRRRFRGNPLRLLERKRVVTMSQIWSDNALHADLNEACQHAGSQFACPYVRMNGLEAMYFGSWTAAGAPIHLPYREEFGNFYRKFRVLSATLSVRVYNLGPGPLFVALHKHQPNSTDGPGVSHGLDNIVREGRERWTWTSIPPQGQGRRNYADLRHTINPRRASAPERNGDQFQSGDLNPYYPPWAPVLPTGEGGADEPNPYIGEEILTRVYVRRSDGSPAAGEGDPQDTPAIASGEVLVKYMWRARVLLSEPRITTDIVEPEP